MAMAYKSGNIEISEKKKHVEDLGHDVRHGYKYICIGYTLGSQCIPGIYARWFLITHEGVARGRYQ